MKSCKECGEEIPIHHVQVGGFHMECAEKEIVVYKVYPSDHGNPVISDRENVMNTIDDCDYDEEWTVIRTKMTAIQLDSLPEHQGW